MKNQAEVVYCLNCGERMGKWVVVDIGSLYLKSRATDPHIWWALGSNGLNDCITSDGGEEKGCRHFGFRLGYLLSQLTVMFRPATVGLTGGIIHKYWRYMAESVRNELTTDIRNDSPNISVPKVMVLKEAESALTGLINLLKIKAI